jgi:hypothetical protein
MRMTISLPFAPSVTERSICECAHPRETRTVRKRWDEMSVANLGLAKTSERAISRYQSQFVQTSPSSLLCFLAVTVATASTTPCTAASREYPAKRMRAHMAGAFCWS